MTKLLRNRFVIAFLSFVSAIVLCAYVYANVAALSTTQSNTASVVTTKTVTNVPVKIVDTSNSKYVSGVPETVVVHLSGPRNLLLQLNEQTIGVETTDLAALNHGTNTLKFEVVGLPVQVTGEVLSGDVEVTIEPLATMEVAVVGVVPENIVADGYMVRNVTTNPEKVTLTSSAAELAKVSRVTATIPTTTQVQNETFTQSNINVVVQDAAGNILDIKVSRPVSVNVQLINKEVDADIVLSLLHQKSNYTYAIQSQSQSQTTVVKSADVPTTLNAIIDVANLEAGIHTLTVPVLAPYGVTLTKIRTVTVTIVVSPVTNE